MRLFNLISDEKRPWKKLRKVCTKQVRWKGKNVNTRKEFTCVSFQFLVIKSLTLCHKVFDLWRAQQVTRSSPEELLRKNEAALESFCSPAISII